MEKKNGPLFAEERKKKILDILDTENKIIVPELSARLGVSATTIRKDLKDLETSNLLLRTHGGAISISKSGFEQLPSKNEVIMSDQKKAIARRALDYIQDGDTIALLTGTTIMELVKILTERSNLRVIVNDLRFAMFLEQNTDFSIYLLSGLIRNNYHYVTSPLKSELLSLMNIDKAFITCNGFTPSAGATTPDLNTAVSIRRILDHSDSVFLLCDSSKIGFRSFAQIVQTKDISCLITDSDIADEDATYLSNTLETVIAKVST